MSAWISTFSACEAMPLRPALDPSAAVRRARAGFLPSTAAGEAWATAAAVEEEGAAAAVAEVRVALTTGSYDPSASSSSSSSSSLALLLRLRALGLRPPLVEVGGAGASTGSSDVVRLPVARVGLESAPPPVAAVAAEAAGAPEGRSSARCLPLASWDGVRLAGGAGGGCGEGAAGRSGATDERSVGRPAWGGPADAAAAGVEVDALGLRWSAGGS